MKFLLGIDIAENKELTQSVNYIQIYNCNVISSNLKIQILFILNFNSLRFFINNSSKDVKKKPNKIVIVQKR